MLWGLCTRTQNDLVLDEYVIIIIIIIEIVHKVHKLAYTVKDEININ